MCATIQLTTCNSSLPPSTTLNPLQPEDKLLDLLPLPLSTNINDKSNVKLVSKKSTPNLKLDPISEYRAWQALSIYFTILLNRQLRRRWNLEHESLKDRPLSHRFRPVIFLEPVPTLQKPPANITTKTLTNLQTKVHLLRGRVEKGKELASEIERRMQDPRIQFPTHFCHTCVVGGEEISAGNEILLTKCGHRVCRTCLSFGVSDDGVYECAICFVPASFVARSALSMPRRTRSEEISSSVLVSRRAKGHSSRSVSFMDSDS